MRAAGGCDATPPVAGLACEHGMTARRSGLTRPGSDDRDGDSPMSSAHLLERLLWVRSAAVAAEARRAEALTRVAESRRVSAANLVHYLALRGVDLRAEQGALAERGLSSLGRAEAHVLATLDAVIRRVAGDATVEQPGALHALPEDLGQRGPSVTTARSLAESSAADALGFADGATRVMVTLPSEAAADPALVDEYVRAGMTIARINAAHDSPDDWARMAANVRAAAATHGVSVKVAFDLAGPKLRVGPIEPGPSVVKVRPRRDAHGRVTQPGRVRLVHSSGVPVPDDAIVALPASPELIDGAEPGDEIVLTDARGKTRSFRVIGAADGAVDVATDSSAYLDGGLGAERRRGRTAVASGRLGTPVARPGAVELRAGDALAIRVGTAPGRSARRSPDGTIVDPATISVDVPELIHSVRPGDRVLFDDGTIESVVDAVCGDAVQVRVLRPERAKLRAEKGVNLPDRPLIAPIPCGNDLDALRIAVTFADLVGLSYVSDADDVVRVHDELERLGAADVGVILKIEHRVAFDHLPDLLIAAMRRPPAAVMVARGDLAIELGFERLAEVQEEILWLCEAAHVPVIWATQVLEHLAKTGAPTRAEVTDAAWSSRAECVMLNKGPFIPDTIRFLGDVVSRMHGHQTKRTPMLRRLSVAGDHG